MTLKCNTRRPSRRLQNLHFHRQTFPNTITLDIGGTVNVTADQGLGTYTGNITVRANPILTC